MDFQLTLDVFIVRVTGFILWSFTRFVRIGCLVVLDHLDHMTVALWQVQ